MILPDLRRHANWIWLGGALVLLLVIRVLASSPSPRDVPLSVHNDRPDGGSALYSWLQRAGYRTREETDPHLGLASLQPGRDTLFVLAPSAQFSSDQVALVTRWLARGGRLVAATGGATATQLFRRMNEPAPANFAGEHVRVVQPLLLSPPVAVLKGSSYASFEPGSPGALAAISAEGRVLERRSIAAGGAVWFLSAPSLLDNSHLARGDNWKLALNLAGPRGSTVAFDEAPAASLSPARSGSGSPFGIPADWAVRTPWGVVILFLLAVAVVYRWLSGWRLGPPVVPLTEGHRASSEYVVSLAALLRRGRHRNDVLLTYQRGLRRLIAQRLQNNLSSIDPSTRQEIERLLATPQSLGDEQLVRQAEAIVGCEDELRRIRV